MNRKSVIEWKNVEVTIDQDGDCMIILLFVDNVCVGRSEVEVEE